MELPVYEKLLSPEELLRSRRFFKAEDRDRYIISRAILKQLSGLYINTAPESIEIVRDQNKKPIIKDFEHLHFNISHSGNCVAFAFSGSSVGIDVEFINNDFDYKPIAAICFTDSEINFAEESNKPADEFFKLWTRKEALLKATGEGLHDDMNKLNCLNDPFSSDITDTDYDSYRINTFEIAKNYIASIAYSYPEKKLRFYEK